MTASNRGITLDGANKIFAGIVTINHSPLGFYECKGQVNFQAKTLTQLLYRHHQSPAFRGIKGMTQQPIDKNKNAATSLVFAKLRKLEKRITAIEVDASRDYSFTIFHPDGRVGQLESRIEQLEESSKTNTKAIVEAWRSNIPSRVKVRPFSLFEFTVNLCTGLILASATAMITRIAYDFVMMPDGAAVEQTLAGEKR